MPHSVQHCTSAAAPSAAPWLQFAQDARARARPDLGVGLGRPSRWITRERPKIDRIACPWLVLRFIDPQAQFHCVPTQQVLGEAKRLDAVAYDIPGAPISHVGELCSFDALLSAFELASPALERLARIVRGADTDRLQLEPQSAGLMAISLGACRTWGVEAKFGPSEDSFCRICRPIAKLWDKKPVKNGPLRPNCSRRFPKSDRLLGLSSLHQGDHQMLAAALPLYDALYAWCRDAHDEAHGWKPETMVQKP